MTSCGIATWDKANGSFHREGEEGGDRLGASQAGFSGGDDRLADASVARPLRRTIETPEASLVLSAIPWAPRAEFSSTYVQDFLLGSASLMVDADVAGQRSR